MDVALTSAEGLPDKAYVSIRVGETRRQASWKAQQQFHFPSGAASRSVHVDVFEKLGSAQISLAGIRAWEGCQKADVSIPRGDGPGMKLNLSLEVPEAKKPVKAAKPAQKEAAKQAMDYMERSGAQRLLSQLVQTLMLQQPDDPLAFIASFAAERQSDPKPAGPCTVVASAGPAPQAAALPDLSGHFSLLAEAFKQDPALYSELRDRTTKMGVSLEQVIRPGIENRGHRMIKTTGIVAGDAECYTTFAPLFGAVVGLRYGEAAQKAHQPLSLDYSLADSEPMDPTGCHVLRVQLRVSRNLQGSRFPSACDFDERREVEQVLSGALLELGGGLGGTYHPLAGSCSFPMQPGGMDAATEAELQARQTLFFEPDSAIAISSGVGRDWPDARGVFAAGTGLLWAWLNEEDHLRLFSAEDTADLRGAFARLCLAESTLRQTLQQQGHTFAQSEQFGYLTTGPANLGTGLCATAFVSLPNLSAQPDFRSTCRKLRLQAAYQSETGHWALSNADRMGCSEVDQVNVVIASVRKLIALELELESKGQDAGSATSPASPTSPTSNMPEISDLPGLGSQEYPGFPAGQCPEQLPDLSRHNSLMAEVLRSNPSLYDSLRGLKTTSGVTFAKAIKPGVDIKGHPMIKSVGAVAGDEESYETFRAFFDQVIAISHGGFAQDLRHSSALDPGRVGASPIDPEGRYVVSARVAAARNLRGRRLLPACTGSERRKVEQACVKALSEVGGGLGDYYPLESSTSYILKPQGMTSADAAWLGEAGALFDQPTAAMVLASGAGRHWPDARGVFAGGDIDFVARVNDEDHLHLSVARPSLQQAFSDFCDMHKALEAALAKSGHAFMHSERLGFLTTCPSALGSAMQVSIKVRLPQLSARKDFKSICRVLQLDARQCSDGDGMWDLSHRAVLGVSEAAVVDVVACGCRHLVGMEEALAAGHRVAPPGLGAEALHGFSAEECPEELPDLCGHRNLAARVLCSDPSIYTSLRGLRTAFGVPLALVVKPAVDVLGVGAGGVTPIGLVAGDAECYTTFAPLFLPALDAFHGRLPDVAHPSALDPSLIEARPAGQRVVSVRLRLARSLAGARLPPACSADERREVERVLAESLSELSGRLSGEYSPLRGSGSFLPQPSGMGGDTEKRLEASGVLFQEPRTCLKLSMGLGRDWPDARGVYLSDDAAFAAWINEEEHLSLIATSGDGDAKEAFERLCGAERALRETLQQKGHDFARDERLGFITAMPERLGTGLSVIVKLRLPKVGASGTLANLCEKFGLQVLSKAPGGVIEVANRTALGVSEAELVNATLDACAGLAAAEEV